MGSRNKSKVKKGGKQASQTKLSNKKTSRLAKQGKLKKRKRKTPTNEQESDSNETSRQVENSQINGQPDSEDLSEDDIEFFSTPGRNSSFISTAHSSLLSESTPAPKNKRKRPIDNDEPEAEYEKIPRKMPARKESDVKHVLPIKTKTGIVPQTVDLLPQEELEVKQETNKKKVAEEDMKDEEKTEDEPELSHLQLYVLRKKKLADRKQRIAVLCNSIIENPEENIKKLKELHQMLEESEPGIQTTIRKLVIISLMEVFKDIIPAYRIRITTDKEKQQKAKKDTKTLRDYEEGLLRHYRLYLESLEMCAKGKSSNGKKWDKKKHWMQMDMSPEMTKMLRHIAVKCLCELLLTHPHFNYRNNIITVIVPFMNNSDQQKLVTQLSCATCDWLQALTLSSLCCDAIREVFKQDKAGDVSLEIVKFIGKMIKSRDFHIKRQVLDVFLSLKIKEVEYQSDEKKITGKQKREEMKKLSKREKKKRKKMELLERELRETKATEDRKQRMKLHTETIQAVFLTYFRILKAQKHSVLLAAVLEGLARFAHLINIDFFDDLFQVFNDLIESQKLSDQELLHCVQTAFTILSGQGAALNIDPNKFYCHLYNILFHVHAGKSSGDIPTVLHCLDSMLTKRRRQISQQRILAFLKRLCTMSLLQTHQGALSLLSAVRNFVMTYKYSELLYDNETQGSGLFLPELPDPEHSNAHNTMLWEMSLLQHHYHPVVRKFTTNICRMAATTGDGQLPLELARKTSKTLYDEYSLESSEFKPVPPASCKSRQKRFKDNRGFLQEEIISIATRTFQSIPDVPEGVIK